MTVDSWEIGVDTGGTFTDCVAVDRSGRVRRAKVLSTSALRGTIADVLDARTFRAATTWDAPDGFATSFGFRDLSASSGEVEPAPRVASFDADGVIALDASPRRPLRVGVAFELRSPEEAPLLAVRLATGTPHRSPLPPLKLRLATTRGTNALLERRGAKVALFVTRGFADLPAIGDQRRPDLFALAIVKSAPLATHFEEVDERLAADGAALHAPDLAAVAAAARRARAAGATAAAIALAHADVNPAHERRVAEVLRAEGFDVVARSSEIAPFVGLLARMETASAEAFLDPVLRGYLDGVATKLPRNALRVMTSSGGLVSRAAFRAVDSLLSGPAGGVVGMAAAGERAGFRRVIGFDMGGTSTDVSRHDGAADYVFAHEVGGVRLAAPAVAVESVAAGGGSICAFEHDRLQVGPRSAGAAPGPACYGAGGPLTLTDVNLLLGRVDPHGFPIPVDVAAARAAAERVRAQVEAHECRPVALDALLQGFLDVADERMADAIRVVTVRRGVDPRRFALVAFGGAGGQHACAVAERLGIEAVIVPRDASVLSADGLLRASIERFAARQVLQPLAVAGAALPELWRALEDEAIAALVADGASRATTAVVRRIAELRFVGQDATLDVERPATPDADALRAAFRERTAAVFGVVPEERDAEVVALRVVAALRSDPRAEASSAATSVGGSLAGPTLLKEPRTAIWVAAGWTAARDAEGAWVLRRAAGEAAERAAPSRVEGPDAVRLELFTNRFRAVAEEMGERLRRTAVSVNIKERLDFSCGLLDAAGALVVNAPHIPVHLGALGACVSKLIEVAPCDPGDVYVVNHPAFGGSHLPDVTVVTPVHLADGRRLGFVASRAHHAELGGKSPGSMPPDAARLIEEGVVIPPTPLFVAV